MKAIFWFVLGLTVALDIPAFAEFVDRYGNGVYPSEGYYHALGEVGLSGQQRHHPLFTAASGVSLALLGSVTCRQRTN